MELRRKFSKEKQMGKKHFKSVIRKIQIRMTLTFYLTLVRVTSSGIRMTESSSMGVAKRKFFGTVGRVETEKIT